MINEVEGNRKIIVEVGARDDYLNFKFKSKTEGREFNERLTT